MEVQPGGPSFLTMALAACSALFAALSGLLGWSAKRQVGRADNHSERLRALETSMAKKGDISFVTEQLDALRSQSRGQFEAISARLDDQNTRMGQQHAQILQTIIGLKGD